MESRRKIIQEQLISEPEDVFLNYALGLEFFSEKNFIEAINQFEKTLSIDKNYLGLDYFLKETLKRHILKKYGSTHVLLFLEWRKLLLYCQSK